MAGTAQQRRIIEQAANASGISPSLLYGVWGQETGFGTSGTSSAGAQGPFQFMPGTAKSLGIDPLNFRQAAFGAAKYLAQYKGRGVKGMLAAYNAGPNGNPNNSETQAYIPAVLGYAKQWKGQGPGSDMAAPGPSTMPSQDAQIPQGGPDAATLLLALQAAQKPAGPPSSTLQAPQFAAGPKLAGGGSLPPSSGAPQPKQQDLPSLLAAISQLGSGTNNGTLDATSPNVTASSPGKIAKGAQAGVPVLREKSEGALHDTAGLAGYPAHDFFAPAGSAAVAPVTGKVVRFSGHDPAAGPVDGPHGPFGYSVYIQGDDGKEYYLTHMGSRSIKVGQTVRQGQVIGTVGNYAKYGGANHIHMGVHSPG